MQYKRFTKDADAQAFLEEVRAAGFAAHVVEWARDAFEVRYWK